MFTLVENVKKYWGNVSQKHCVSHCRLLTFNSPYKTLYVLMLSPLQSEAGCGSSPLVSPAGVHRKRGRICGGELEPLSWVRVLSGGWAF